MRSSRGVIVDAAFHHAIDFHRSETGDDGGVYAAAVLDPRRRSRRFMRVKMSLSRVSRLTVTRAQAIRVEVNRVLGQEDSIGGQRDIVDAGDGGEITDEIGPSWRATEVRRR